MGDLILVIEDDEDSASILEAYLTMDGFRVICAADGKQGLAVYNLMKPSLVLLDMMLPLMGGAEVLAAIRGSGNVPVIMVTAVGDEYEKIGALRYGADDYIVKPCNPREVVARVRAVLRRCTLAELDHSVSCCENVWVDTESFMAWVGNDKENVLDLTRSEFLILSSLIKKPHKAFSREELLEACVPESDALARVIDTHIHNLRKKLEVLKVYNVLVTVRSVGYRFR